MTPADETQGEAKLVRLARKGDQEAFAALYRSTVDRIYRYLRARVATDQTAEDLTADVFIKAWDHLPRYRPGRAPFVAWLFRIARNTMIDHFRANKDALPLDTAAQHLEDAAGDVEQQVERRMRGDRLRAALEELTEDQAQVLSLRFLGGLSTLEVALALGKRQGAVRALQMRGLRALAKLLEEGDEAA